MVDAGVLRPVLLRMLEGRVGSTLVMQLLGTAPAVAFDRVYPFENSYLSYFTRLIGQISAAQLEGGDMVDLLYGDAGRVGPLPFAPASLDRGALAGDSLHGVWAAFSRAIAGNGAHLYAEKFWGELAPVIAAGLDPIVIDLVRDPRDIVASVRAFNVKTGRALFGRAQAPDDRQHLRRLVVGMTLRLEEFAQPLPVPRLSLRYEDLIADFDAQAGALSRLLEVPLDPGAVIAARSSMSPHVTSETPERSVARWARDLRPDEIATIERRLGRHMTRLGYTLSEAAPPPTGPDPPR